MKIILAYSGGLDTSIAIPWLKANYKAEIIAFCANIGQFESLDHIKEKALSSGASKVYIEDLREDYISNYAFVALRANAAYQEQYLLAAPLGRPLIAKRMVEIARQEKADAVAHGSTGKGNDQVRFYNSILAHDPKIKVIAPLMEWEMNSRDEQIEYAKKHQIEISVSKSKPYSIDTNIWGTSIECGPLDDFTLPPPSEVYQITRNPLEAPDDYQDIEIKFEKGIPVAVDNRNVSPVQLVSELNHIGATYGIGRIDIMEDRLVGIKTRGIYESPGAYILQQAHKELESLVLDRDTLQHKRMIEQKYSKLVYNGLWFTPLKAALDCFIDFTQTNVNGSIVVRLYKGGLIVQSRKSDFALYDHNLSTYGANNTYSKDAGIGFCYIYSMPTRINSIVQMKYTKQRFL